VGPRPIPYVVDILGRIGFPAYFATILGISRILALAALLVPRAPRLKEWAYTGLTFVYLGAAACHVAVDDDLGAVITPLVLAAITLASWALRPPSRHDPSPLRTRRPTVESDVGDSPPPVSAGGPVPVEPPPALSDETTAFVQDPALRTLAVVGAELDDAVGVEEAATHAVEHLQLRPADRGVERQRRRAGRRVPGPQQVIDVATRRRPCSASA
jgi:hypothetical protein